MKSQSVIKNPNRLPSMPRVVALALQELDSPEPDLRRIGQLLQQDLVLTARLLVLANSARFNLSRGVSSVAEALPLLGLNELRDLLYVAALASAFREVGGLRMADFWRYSLDTAKLARKLASGTAESSSAYSAGLLHAAGELVMHHDLPLSMADLDHRVDVYDLQRVAAEIDVLGYSYAEVGAAFARHWSLPQVLIRAIEFHVSPAACTDRLPGWIHLAVWRARIAILKPGAEVVQASFPALVAASLQVDRHLLLDESIIEWTSDQEVSSLV